MPGTSTIGRPVEIRNSSGSEVGAGLPVLVSASFTRPNDATAYAAGDAMTDSTSAPTVITFNNCARVTGGSGVIVGASMLDSANQATKLSCELWLFDTAPTPDNDNAAFTPTDAELANRIGIIPFTTSYVGDATAGAGGNAVYEAAAVTYPFTCTAKALYGLVVARNAYTPVANENFAFDLRILQE